MQASDTSSQLSAPRTAPASRRAVLTASLAVPAASAGVLGLSACDTGGDSTDPGVRPGERLAALDDVPVGEPTYVRTESGGEAYVYRSDDTTVAAFGTICTHQGCSVQPDGAELRCPCHQSVFDAATGEVVSGPAPSPLPAVRVTIEGEEIVAE
ncbi:Rieske (2Fe-2S) protein [Streptomyces sp. RFCAC02]|uniref:Rieske (2Fe-2S) protein n=1 Tax=Streptomyces sp. RFCAC02 TaxID=2499143 RepID=UPI00101F13B2|nr:Rieske (2Fe-2S) protein [Streptomyces sp. RFCAC02]